MREVEIVVAQGDDWEGIYINGHLETEGHSIPLSSFLDWAVESGPVHVVKVVSGEVNIDWINDCGSLPNNLEDVVWSGEPWERRDDE